MYTIMDNSPINIICNLHCFIAINLVLQNENKYLLTYLKVARETMKINWKLDLRLMTTEIWKERRN